MREFKRVWDFRKGYKVFYLCYLMKHYLAEINKQIPFARIRDAQFYAEQIKNEEAHGAHFLKRLNRYVTTTGLGLSLFSYFLGSFNGEPAREIRSRSTTIDSRLLSDRRKEFSKASYAEAMKLQEEGSDKETIVLDKEGQVLTERAQMILCLVGLPNPGSSIDTNGRRPVTREGVISNARRFSKDKVLDAFETHLGYIKEVLDSYK